MNQSLSRLVVTVALAITVTACFAAAAAAAPPKATTEAATRISGTTATLNGVIDTGGEDVIYAIYYGNNGTKYESTSEYGSQTETKELAGSGSPVKVAEAITGLEPETTYHFRLVVLNPDTGKGSLGSDVTFTTGAVFAPRLEAEKMPSSVMLSRNKPGEPVLVLGSSPIHCSLMSGFIEGGFSKATSSFKTFTAFESCTLGGMATSITTNSCRFSYNIGPAGPPSFNGSVSIGCSKAGDKIVISIPAISCTVKIGAQEPTSTVTYANEGQGSTSTVRMVAGSSNVSVTKENPENNFWCSLIAVNGTASFTHDMTLTASASGSTGLYVIGD